METYSSICSYVLWCTQDNKVAIRPLKVYLCPPGDALEQIQLSAQMHPG